MGVLSVGERRDGCRHAAAARHAKEARTQRSIEHDDVVATPAPAAPACRVGQLRGWSAGDRNLLQLAPGEEGDELAVGRPERKRSALGSLIGRASPLASGRSQIWNAAWAPATNTMLRPSGEIASCAARPVPPAAGPPKTVFSGGAIVNWTGSGAIVRGAGHSQCDDRCGDHRDD